MSRTFGAAMGELRRARGLSQRTASAELGISQALLSHYEKGAREPGLDFVVRACNYYGVSADYLLGRSDRRAGNDEAERLRELAGRLREIAEGLEALADLFGATARLGEVRRPACAGR